MVKAQPHKALESLHPKIYAWTIAHYYEAEGHLSCRVGVQGPHPPNLPNKNLADDQSGIIIS